MNWELVLQIIILSIVFLGIAMLGWAMWDTAQKNKHERNLETLRVSRSKWHARDGEWVHDE